LANKSTRKIILIKVEVFVMKKKVALLYGGASYERDISIQSAKEVEKYINKENYIAKLINVPEKKDSLWIKELLSFSPDVVLNLLHGGEGENGSVSGLLNCLDIPLAGNGVLSGAICMNKNICKAILKENGVPVCEDVFIKKEEDIIDYEEKIKELGFPVIVKPNNGGGSIGISIAENITETKKAIKHITEILKDDVLIEKFIFGREVTSVVFQKENSIKVFPILDISTENKFYDYNAKYIDNNTKIVFSTLPEFMREMIKDISQKVYKIFECTGLCYIDLIVYEEQVYFIEVNTNPGFTSRSTITRVLKELGVKMCDFIDELIKNTINQNKGGTK